MGIETIDYVRVLRGGIAVLTLCGGGLAAGTSIDLFEAKAFQEARAAELAQARIDRERIIALEAQTGQLMAMVDRCWSKRRREAGETPPPPEEPNVIAPWGVIE